MNRDDRRLRFGVGGLLAAACLVPAVAMAAPPSNDARESAQALTIPGKVAGTTAESTREESEPFSDCGQTAGTVWYSFTAPAKGNVVIDLKAAGDLDATVDIFRRNRSQLSEIDCQRTDEDGEATSDFRVDKDQAFLVRVSQLSNSVPGTFDLDVQFAAPAERPPGARLAARGASGTLDRVTNPLDAYAVNMREGVKYRVNLVPSDSEACLPLTIYPPGTEDLETGQAVKTERCGGYATFTPGAGQGGRYSIVASAGRSTESKRYHLQVARAGSDDISPGVFVKNYQRVSGSLRGGGIDVQDLYRFDVTRRSALNLRLSTKAAFDLVLLKESGGTLECQCSGQGREGITTTLPRGRYYAVVRATGGANGSYKLTRISRTITSTKARVDGRGKLTTRPGESVRLGVRVTARAEGPADVFVERFDPVDGWSFYKQFGLTVRNGSASLAWTPPAVGSYRVRAQYYGARGTQASESGFARLKVAEPLQQKRGVMTGLRVR